ncbi:extracellular solute-binding protein [Caldilinea sp.]|uniref:ABC transporter substrate-binding protein n=1 Tax=Caldilinea sp. TaxID=2293560 RepID=UPI002BD4A853|nr:extracellular solute-binding protein [Anaerolineales bacterium]HQY90165.1 extracellular solute-binding protein [Caldilinea sp.]
MRNHSNIVKFLTVALLFAMVASACVATPPAAAPAAGEQPAADSGAAAEQPAASGEKVVLRWANIFDATGVEKWQPIVDAFEAKYPNIEISSESTAGSGAAVYPDLLKTSMASGSPPDVFFMWGGSIAQPFIDAGQVMDLGPYYEKFEWNGKFAPWVVDRISYDGKTYGVPFNALGMGFWYRTDIFAENGWTVPTTFAEQEELCGKMKDAGMYCVSLGGKFGWHTMRVLDYFIEHTCGPELHDKLNRLEESWDQQCVIDAYTIFQTWIDNGWVVPDFLTVSPDDSRFPFFAGDAGLVLEGVWYEGVLKNNEQDVANFDFYLPPTDQEPLRFSAFPEQWMIPASAAHPDEAAEFINFITSAETQKQFPDNFANSATVGVNPDCNEWPLSCRWRDIILTATDTHPPTDQAFVKELMDGFFEVQDSIVAKRFTPEEGAALMQQRVEEWQAQQ